ncbi:hypothetical protein PILCRDRAFT_8117 [Piloderma croceum F 1598]|uniref:polynucleotide adenylyltransferase n=1 Tax=Piloderma croceum (strain F 1598) TaxID=765440 RepID=A0A0C3FRF4_PILCF|nr:hypothetical protein PILCRDRAFT_8117 [Piloderma croceum F 1598]
MASTSHSRSLLERISSDPSDPWAYDHCAAEETFQPRPRRPKRKQEPEIDSEYLYTPWIDAMKVKGDESKNQRLHDEIVAYMAYVQPTSQEETTRRQVYDFIKKTVKGRFHRSEMSLFGSVAHDLCLPDGDLDVVIRLPGVDDQNDKKRVLFQLASALTTSGVTKEAQVKHFARVPVVTFQTVPNLGSLNFDLGINNTDGFAAVETISSYLRKMPALRPLVLVLKSFLKQRKLNSAATSGLSSYAVTCMAISFLQLNPANRPSESIDKALESGSLGTILMDFLHYYGTTFPYDDSYISVNQGKLLPKESADWINDNGRRDRLVIQCLVDPENDVGKSAGKIEQIKVAFREVHETLSNFTYTTTSTNILGSTNIVRITQKTIDQRAHISDIVDSGKLLALPPAPVREEHRLPRSYSNNGHSQKSNQYRPRRDDSYHSERDSLRHGSSGSGSGHGDRYHPANKRRRY